MASDKNIVVQWIGGLIFILVYSAQAVQENSETEGIFGSVPNDWKFISNFYVRYKKPGIFLFYRRSYTNRCGREHTVSRFGWKRNRFSDKISLRIGVLRGSGMCSDVRMFGNVFRGGQDMLCWRSINVLWWHTIRAIHLLPKESAGTESGLWKKSGRWSILQRLGCFSICGSNRFQK